MTATPMRRRQKLRLWLSLRSLGHSFTSHKRTKNKTMNTKQLIIIAIALYLGGANIVVGGDTKKKADTPKKNSPPAASSSTQSTQGGGADIEVEEDRRFVYSAKLLREGVKIGTIGDNFVPGQNKPHVDFAPLFFGKGVVFKGDMVDY